MKLPPFDYACPATIPEAVQLLASHDDAKAIAGGQSLMPMLAFRLAHPTLAGRPAQARRAARDQDFGPRRRARRHGALARHRGRRAARDRASAAQGRGRACGALSDPQSRHGRRQHRARRSGRRDARHRGDLRRRDRGGRQIRRARDPGRRFLPGPADDRAHIRRDHHRGPAAGLAGAPALGLPGIRPPPRRFRHGRRGGVLRPGRERPRAQRACRASSASPTGRCA